MKYFSEQLQWLSIFFIQAAWKMHVHTTPTIVSTIFYRRNISRTAKFTELNQYFGNIIKEKKQLFD